MQQGRDIELRRYADGTPSVLRKPTVYAELYFYKKSEVLVQLTKAFCDRFLPHYGDRTVDQMVQAARSIKQNIVEGLVDGETSFETEIKLLGVARGSNRELMEDYRDYLSRHQIAEWASDNKPRFDRLRTFAKGHSDLAAYEPYFYRWTDEEMANTAVCLCHMVDRAISTFIEKRDHEFVAEGGIRERMTAARLEMRGTQKQVIAQQEKEIAQLRAQVASLERELARYRAGEAENAGEGVNAGNFGLSGNFGTLGLSGKQ